MSKLDDILENDPLKAEAGFTTRRKEQIKALMLELIGEDEPEYTTRRNVNYVGIRMGRNQIRAELRQKVNEL